MGGGGALFGAGGHLGWRSPGTAPGSLYTHWGGREREGEGGRGRGQGEGGFRIVLINAHNSN